MAVNKELKKLGERIVQIRKSKGISQKALALKCGKTPQSLEMVENGKRNASVLYLMEIARALEVSAGDFFEP